MGMRPEDAEHVFVLQEDIDCLEALQPNFRSSGNDAVHVLTAMNGGVEKTVAEMNAHAKELQALDTTAVSPDGSCSDSPAIVATETAPSSSLAGDCGSVTESDVKTDRCPPPRSATRWAWPR